MNDFISVGALVFAAAIAFFSLGVAVDLLPGKALGLLRPPQAPDPLEGMR